MKCSFTLFRCKLYFLADDKCVNAPFLKQSECSGSKCKEHFKSKWQRIKCLPFSTSGRKGLCSKWCHEGGTSTQSCYDAFHRFSSEQIYFKNGDENFKFEVGYCRSFEFIIRLQRVSSSKYFPFLFLSDPFYLLFSDYHSSSCYYYFIIVIVITITKELKDKKFQFNQP